ncbi:MAG: polyisoprenoid-binding protein [Hyphomicrobiales bacterium]|nr:MAG: polyisoprenoid-binding protein [Hyphomicrobiales bacterium]
MFLRYSPAPHLRRTALGLAAAAILATGLPALAADRWEVDPAASSLTFTGTQAGAPFTGSFQTWTANISFDPETLADSKVTVSIDVTSATTGDVQKDANLPTPNWFNSKAQPMATFAARTFSKTADGFLAEGTLTVRDIDKPVQLPFTLEIDGDMASMKGETTVKRTDFGVGTGVPLEMVGDGVTISVSVAAKRAQ